MSNKFYVTFNISNHLFNINKTLIFLSIVIDITSILIKLLDVSLTYFMFYVIDLTKDKME